MSEPSELEVWLEAGAGSGEKASQVHETPIAKVFVFKDRVLKLKKPVDFGFLDFTTVEKRAWATLRELDFNRQTAPDVYRAVHAVRRASDGALQLGPPDRDCGGALDHVLEMRPFDSDHILANHPEQVDAALAERLGREVARIHARAPLTPKGRGAAALDYVLGSNASQLRTLAPALGDGVERLLADTRQAFDRLALLLDSRRDAGFVRRCHGDLHLGNIVVEARRPILFDCIEFNDVLSEIDVGYDVAFLLMDLAFRERAEAANRVLNAWLDESGRTFAADRMRGLAALPLFLSVRAAVRAHVAGHGGEIELARRYLAAAQAHLDATPPPRLLAVGGLSGSGKSSFARVLAPRLGGACGAAVLRSDEVRKRLFGAGPTERLSKSAYAPGESLRVYRLMRDEARVALGAGVSVVLDAAFLKAREREDARTLASDAAVAFQGFWMEAPHDVLRQRLRSRTGDASDADEAVLDRQLESDPGEIGWRAVDATGSAQAQLHAAGLT